MKRFAAGVAMLCSFASAQNQIGDLTGEVELVDASPGDEGRLINLELTSGFNRRKGATTSVRQRLSDGKDHYIGQFMIPSLYPDQYKISISVLGYGIFPATVANLVAANGMWEVNPPKPIAVTRSAPRAANLRLRVYLRLASFGNQPARGCQDQWPSLAGRVTEGSTAIGGAEVAVLITSAKTGEFLEAASQKTQPDGSYSLAPDPTALAPASEFLLTVRLKGFQPYVRIVRRCDTLPNEIALSRSEAGKLGVISDTIEPAYRFVYFPYLLESIPIPGIRTFDFLALLSPGVLPALTPGPRAGPGIAPGVGTPGQFIVNGLRGRENNFVVDGSDNNDEELGVRRQGFVALIPQPVESIREFQVVSALGDTRYGRNIGGHVNAITRSGAAQFHGGLDGFVTDNVFNARDFFTQNIAAGSAGPPLRRAADGLPVTMDGQPVTTRLTASGNEPFLRSQSAATVSGPIWKPHSFFYASYENIDTSARQERHFSVPTVADRGVNGTGETGFTQFPVNLFGTSVGLTPASLPGDGIFSLYPLPNNPAGPYGAHTWTTTLPANQLANLFAVKTDHRAGAVAMAFRYNYAQEASDLPSTGDAIDSSMRPKIRTQGAAAYVDAALRPGFGSSTRISYGRTSMQFDDEGGRTPLPSRLFPDTPFMLNAPLLLDVNRPSAAGSPGETGFVTAASARGQQLLNAMGVEGAAESERITGPLGQVKIAGYSPVGVDVFRFPQQRNDDTFQIANLTAISRSSHTLKFGFDARFIGLRSDNQRNARPLAEFHGVQGFGFAFGPPSLYTSAASMAAMGVTTGLYQTVASAPLPPLRLSSDQLDLFVLDDLAITRRLRFQIGARYGYSPLPYDADQVILRAFNYQTLSTQVQQAQSLCSPACPNLLQNVLAAFPGDFKSVFGAQPSTWDGRLGAVWDVNGHGSTVVRAGAGIYNGSFPALIVTESRSGFPSALPLNLANFPTYLGLNPFDLPALAARSPYLFNLANPAVRAQDPRLGGIWQNGSLNLVSASDPIALLAQQLSEAYPSLDPVQPQAGLRHPWALQLAASVEHRFSFDNILRISYIGTQARRLLQVTSLDTPPRTELAFGGAIATYTDSRNQLTAPFPIFIGDLFPNLVARPFNGPPAVNGIGLMRTVIETGGSSSYQSLQIDFSHRYARRFLMGSAFTWSHSIDDGSDIFNDQTGYAYPQDAQHRSERASSDFDARLRWVTHFVCDLPEARNRLLRGWRLAGVYTAQSGHPYTVISSIDVNGDGLLTDRTNPAGGLVPAQSADSRVRLALAPGETASDLLASRISGFTGGDGSVGRNAYVSWGLSNLDLALDRSIRLGEQRFISLRAEAFNALNRTQLATPVRILEAAGFGQAVSTQAPARRLQFSLRFHF